MTKEQFEALITALFQAALVGGAEAAGRIVQAQMTGLTPEALSPDEASRAAVNHTRALFRALGPIGGR